MNQYVKTVLAGVTTAGLVGLFAVLFSFNARLARIETKLETLTAKQTIAYEPVGSSQTVSR